MSIESSKSLNAGTQQDSRIGTDQYQRQQQKSTLLETQERTFEKSYFHQKELNQILKKQIEHKENEYKDLFSENKQLKAQAAEYKSRIRELEEKVNEYKIKLEQYRKKMKEFEKKREMLPPRIQVKISSQASSQGEGEEANTLSNVGGSRSDNLISPEITDNGLITDAGTKSIDYLRPGKDLKVKSKRSWRRPSGSIEVDDLETSSQRNENPPGSNESREILSPVRLMAKFDSSDSKKNSNRKSLNDSEEETKAKAGDSQKYTGREDDLNSNNEDEKVVTVREQAIQEAENVDQLARSIVAFHLVPVVTYENSEITPPKSTKNSSFKATQLKHHPGEKRHTSLLFVSPDEGVPKAEREFFNLQPVQCDTQSKLPPVKLFEEYFVIGVDKNDIMAFEEENPDEKMGYLKPKVLFSYPGKPEEMKTAPKNSISDFVFPFGVEAHKEKISSFTQLYEILFPKNHYEMNQNCFVFPLLPGNLVDDQSFENEVLKEGNPNRLLYHVCIKTTDYLELVIHYHPRGLLKFSACPKGMQINTRKDGKKRLKRKYWKVEKVYCFMTFYPLIKFFMQLNIEILDSLKIERLKKFSDSSPRKDVRKLSNEAEEKNIFKEIDAEWINQYLSTELSAYLSNILPLPLPRFNTSFEFKYKNIANITTQICERSQACAMEAVWAGPLVFSYLPMKDLVYLLSAVMLEKKLVLLSENLALLTATLEILYSMIKPFKYPYPMIFNLPNLLLPLCDAPGAALIGINQGITYLLEEELPSNYPECIFAILNQNRINLFADPTVSSGIIEPYFDGVFEQMFSIYKEFNAEARRTIEFGLQASFYKKVEPDAPSNTKEKFIYNASQTEYTKCQSILKLFYDKIFEIIISHLPQKPICKPTEKKELDYEALAQLIVQKNQRDENFLNSFLHTQIFYYYLEQYYELHEPPKQK